MPPQLATAIAMENTKPIDPDMLFESRTIPEIVTFSRSLTQDIDRKREELRTMVGERYRDLMEAADTITHMKESSEKVISSLENVSSHGAELHTRALVGFKSGSGHDHADIDDPNQPYLSVAAEIKLLAMSPEKIWSAVEQEDYLQAVQLYLFARHIHTNLTLSDSSTSGLMAVSMSSSTISSASKDGAPLTSGKIVSTHFPVVNRQWQSVAHFYDAILQGCEKVMKQTREDDGEQGVERVVKAMAALVLLRGHSAEEVFNELLTSRSSTLKEQLRQDMKTETAKVLLEDALNVIRSTMLIVAKAFTSEDEDNNLIGQIKKTSVPTMGLFETRLSPVFKYLPALISEFSPNIIQPVEPLKPEFLSSKIMSWLDDLHGDLIQDSTEVLKHVNSIAALSSIRRHCYELLASPKHSKLKPEVWNQLCLNLLKKDLNLWDEFFRSVFRDRVESLISSHIAGSVYIVQSSLFSPAESFEPEDDLSMCLWFEGNLNEMTALPKFGETQSRGNANKATALELKALGYSPKVQELCNSFDQTLEKLLSDLNILLNENVESEKENKFSFLAPVAENIIEPFDLKGDCDALLRFVQDNVTTQLKNLLEHVASKHLTNTVNRGILLFVGRFLQAIPELCPSLEKCVMAPQMLAKKNDAYSGFTSRRGASSKADPVWTDIKVRLEHESCKAFNLWLGLLTTELKVGLEAAMADDPVTLLKLLPAWDVIEISEETEDGTKVKSKIRVPQHPSIALACSLSNYCNQVYRIAPFSLPGSVQLSLSQMPAKVVCDVYNSISQRDQMIQMVALQLFFDMQFIAQCMISRDSKELSQLNQTCLNSLEGHIDPFDFSVFSSHLTTNVKKCVLRESGMFSILIPSDRFSLLASMKSSLGSSTSQNEQHNAIWTFTHRPDKIPLIPIPKRRKDDLNKRKTLVGNSLTVGRTKMSSVSSGSRKKRDKSPAARGAGSFFEAMSTSWFGGKS